MNELDKISSRIAECMLCPLYKNTNNAVPGEGDASAKLVIIGEAPGRFEDIQGRPFVGMSGRFLNKYLELAGIKREKVFITNAVKHRPPNNRKPTVEEIVACRPYLVEQLGIIRPKLLLALGTSAATSLGFKYKHLEEVRGKTTEITLDGDKYSCFVTFHPSFPMRFPKARETFLNDLKAVKKYL